MSNRIVCEYLGKGHLTKEIKCLSYQCKANTSCQGIY